MLDRGTVAAVAKIRKQTYRCITLRKQEGERVRPARLPKVNWPERESTLYCVHPVLTPVFVNTGRFKLGREALYSTNVWTELNCLGESELTVPVPINWYSMFYCDNRQQSTSQNKNDFLTLIYDLTKIIISSKPAATMCFYCI